MIAVAGAERLAVTELAGRALTASPEGEQSDRPIYPPNLFEPYRTRRYKLGEDMYALLGIARDDKAGRLARFARNYEFFGAPVGLFFVIDERMGHGQWAHLGMFMQSVALAAIERGVSSCMQEPPAHELPACGGDVHTDDACVLKTLFEDWLENAPSTATEVSLFKERLGTRSVGLETLKKLLADHFVGEEVVLKMGGCAKAAQIIKNSLPTRTRTRSGDLGELVATEYVDAKTTFQVPVRKLRWKSDREMPMHGNDIVAIEVKGAKVRVLKGESKSRALFSVGVAEEAASPANEASVLSKPLREPV